MPIGPGKRLGPYEIVDLIGAGGMGEVYRAHDPRLDRNVAIKVLSPHLISRSDLLARFEREAKVVAALSHPNIVAVYDVGTAGDLRYVVTELLDGETLRERIFSEQRMDWLPAAQLVLQVAWGLAAAHERRIVHRDVKPENIFLTSHGPKILDFGLARLDERLQESASTDEILRTPTGLVLGTVGYMSPEQTAGEETGPASDVFSLGCVFYELLAGERPFVRETAAETMNAILREPPKPLPPVDSAVQERLESIISRSLEKKVPARFQTGGELAEAIDQLLSRDRAGRRSPLPTATRVGTETLALLPFEAPSDDPELATVADLATEELQDRIANETSLTVVSRSRVRRLGERPDPENAAFALDATFILTGSLQRSAEQILVHFELVDARRGAQLWGSRKRLADGGESSVRRLMGSVIRELGQHVPLGTLSPSAPTVRVQTPEPETSDESILMLGNARAEMARGSREGYRHAIELLERAVVDSPALALTSSKLAEARLGQALAGFVPTPDVKEKAISEASMAEAQDSSVEVRLIRERVRAFFEWRWDEALDAISELGDSADVAITRAELLVARSESDLAVVEAKRAAALEPLSPSIGERAARVLYLAGRWVDAQEHAHAALIQSDSAIPAKVVLALSLTQQRMYESAHEELLALLRESIDQPDADVALGQLYGLWRKRAGAVKILRRLDHPPRPRFVPQTMIAKIESALGETNAALDRLEAALEAREVHLAFLRADPAWAPIRGHERFRMLEQTVFTPAP